MSDNLYIAIDDMQCCGNCKYQIGTCEPIGCVLKQNNTSARDVCLLWEFDELTGSERRIDA